MRKQNWEFATRMNDSQDKWIVAERVFNKAEKDLSNFVDLGLPSGLLWADRNVGANAPEEFGLYFAWGETEGYSGITDTKKFEWSDYKWCNGSDTTLTKYNYKSTNGIVDNKDTLEQVDDAAYVRDNTCRMPTLYDFDELIANTISTWETLNGVYGRRFISKTNSNSIFAPAGGGYISSLPDSQGFLCLLWANLALGVTALVITTDLNDSPRVGGVPRYYGIPIRPVKSTK